MQRGVINVARRSFGEWARAARTFWAKRQCPRLISATLPVRSLVSAEHPLKGTPRTSSPSTGCVFGDGPNEAGAWGRICAGAGDTITRALRVGRRASTPTRRARAAFIRTNWRREGCAKALRRSVVVFCLADAVLEHNGQAHNCRQTCANSQNTPRRWLTVHLAVDRAGLACAARSKPWSTHGSQSHSRQACACANRPPSRSLAAASTFSPEIGARSLA